MLQQTISSKQELSAGDQVALRSFMLNSAVNSYVISILNSKFRYYIFLLYDIYMTCKCCSYNSQHKQVVNDLTYLNVVFKVGTLLGK